MLSKHRATDVAPAEDHATCTLARVLLLRATMKPDDQPKSNDGVPHPMALETTTPLFARRARRRRFPRTIWAGRTTGSGSYRIVIEGRCDLR
jgi:hypothetical protein